MKNYHSIAITNEEAAPDDEDDDAFDTAKRPLSNDHPSDHLSPPFDADDERPSNLLVGTFNLIATIVGGAALSLPIAFLRCGVAFTTFVMILSACATYASLVMLCDSSRGGGGSSYGEVMRTAFGIRAEECVSLTLFVFLAFVIVAYMVLIRDIWTPLVREALGADDVDGDRVLLAITISLLPFLFQRSLHALRWNCYVGSASIFVLCVALNLGGWRRRRRRGGGYGGVVDDGGGFEVEYFKIPSAQDVMFSFPIVMLSFLCHFNIIAIQNSLRRPTRERLRGLIRHAICACFALMYAFGFGGYYYAGNETQGNILLNVPISRRRVGGDGGEDNDDYYDHAGEYYLFLLGRIGCGTTMMLGLPMMALPCREALLEVVDVRFHRSHRTNNSVAREIADDVGGTTAGGNEEEGRPWKLFRRCNKYETVRDASIVADDEVVEIAPGACHHGETPVGARSILIRRVPIQSDYVFRNSLAHYGSTLMIVAACYVGAVAVSGVAVVWSFIGSSMAFFISFVLPCGSFIVIENAAPDRRCGWVRLAWTMLLLSVVGAALCTINSIRGSE